MCRASIKQVYEGMWEDDVESGEGLMAYPPTCALPGALHAGSSTEPAIHPRGVVTFGGQFKKGQAEGSGTLALADGCLLVGRFKAGNLKPKQTPLPVLRAFPRPDGGGFDAEV